MQQEARELVAELAQDCRAWRCSMHICTYRWMPVTWCLREVEFLMREEAEKLHDFVLFKVTLTRVQGEQVRASVDIWLDFSQP